IKLSGLLHSDDNCALKEVARQLCLEHQLQFSKAASFDDNSQFMCKQRLLYSLLDAMQSITSQAVVIPAQRRNQLQNPRLCPKKKKRLLRQERIARKRVEERKNPSQAL
ncbi:hypothetical protein K1719_047559, partial [Acacia pycnantha]